MSEVSQRSTATAVKKTLSVNRTRDGAVADSDYASDVDTAEHRPDKP